jgi:transcriptional regulator with XRE-family HTH domain
VAKKERVFSRQTLQAASLLGLQIKEARVKQQWATSELAERAGISAPTLLKVERGDPTVGLGVALDVAGLVGVPLFFEEPGRLGREVARQRELVTLLPQRVRTSDEDVNDDF